MTEQLPVNIERILKHLTDYAAGYSTGMKWNEEAKLKSDLMENRHRWSDVAPDLIQERLQGLGMTDEDTRTIVNLVKRAQSGKKLVPQKTYKGFKFNHDQN